MARKGDSGGKMITIAVVGLSGMSILNNCLLFCELKA